MKTARLLLVLILLSFGIYKTTAQSVENIRMYDLGMKLYDEGKYLEAAETFAIVDSLDDLDFEEYNPNARKGYGKHWQAYCLYKSNEIEKAKALDEENYDIIPVDRRMMQIPDSLCNIAKIHGLNGEYEKAVSLYNQSLENMRLQNLVNYITYIYCLISKAEVIAVMGDKDNFVSLVDSILAEFDRGFPNHPRNRKYIMKYFLDIASEVNDIVLCRKYYETLVGYLKDTNQYEDAFTIDVHKSYAHILLNYGEFQNVDIITNEMLRLAGNLFGKDSWPYKNLIYELITLNLQIKRLDVAKQFIDLEESYMASQKGEIKNERLLYLQMVKGYYHVVQGDMEEAVRLFKWVYRHADYRTQSGKECISMSIPIVSMLKASQGKVDKGLVEEMKQLYERMKDDVSDNTEATKGLLMQAFFTNGYIADAVQIADNLTNSYSEDYQVYSLCMLVYLGSGEYLKARKVGHKALELLNNGLGQKNMVSTALGHESNIDAMLQTVNKIKSQKVGMFSSVPDTTQYALNLLRQDLLQAKLRILEHKDGVGSENFMSTLKSFYFCAYNANKDAIIADSIMSEYTSKLSNRYGADSEQIKAIERLKERCEFEQENPSVSIPLRIYEKGSELYNEALTEYNQKFEEWKQTKDNPLKEEKTPQEFVPAFPSWWSVREVANSDSLFNEVWKTLLYYETDSNFSEILTKSNVSSWCYSAQKANRLDSLACFAKRIIPKINSNYDKQILMWNIWLYAGDRVFDECLSLICNENDNLEMELSCLLYAIDETYYDYNYENLAPAMIRVNRIIEQLKTSIDEKDKMRYYTALIYTNLVKWRNYYNLKMTKSDVKTDFLNMYHEIGNEKSLWKYREFNKMLDVTCLLHEFSDKDSIVVEINRTRILAQAEASKANDNTWTWLRDDYDGEAIPTSLFMPSISLWDNEIDELYRNVHFAYNGQNTYKRDYEFYKFWLDFFKKRYDSNDAALSKRLEMLLGDIVRSSDNKDADLNGLAYDLAIWNKGFLLRSDQQVAKTLMESGNKTILERYKEYLQIKQKLSDSKTDEELAASLRKQAESIWSELKRESKTFDDYTKHLDASWKDIQACLGEKDLAIEYVSASNSLGEDCYAILLRKDFSYPVVVDRIWNIDKLVKEKGDSIYTAYLSYNNPWPYFIYIFNSDAGEFIYPFRGIENVYFSPAGSLNKLSIENMIADEESDSLMSEKYHVYRLSNTRDLISKKRINSNEKKKKAILFGGINYDFSQDQWAEVSSSLQNDQLYALRSSDDSGRGAQNLSLNYLKGTQAELDKITDVLKANRINHTSFAGNDATEDMFKSQSNQGVTSLHIATHGFYATSLEKKKDDDYEETSSIQEDKSMMQNGLYFAGANTNFFGEDIPDNVNDGILTAQEVSYLDFTDCDLVTLSACETGLGEVSGEGVFGLQRGFKKAGVNSILMSLWKVDDEATCKLMTEFYSNWIAKKMTKHDALEAAKKTIRETKGWEDPKYWAAFILLDALD